MKDTCMMESFLNVNRIIRDKVHPEVVRQIKEYGKIDFPGSIQRAAGSGAFGRLALRLYGYWLTKDIETLKAWFVAWLDEELEQDIPEGSVTITGQVAYDL